MKLKLGELNARMLCQFTAFAEVVSSVFGKKEDDDEGPALPKGSYTDLAGGGSYENAIANINAALRFG